MINDYYGCPIYTERDLVDIYMKNPKQKLNNTFTDKKIEIDPTLEIENAPHLIEHTLAQMSVADFDDQSLLFLYALKSVYCTVQLKLGALTFKCWKKLGKNTEPLI